MKILFLFLIISILCIASCHTEISDSAVSVSDSMKETDYDTIAETELNTLPEEDLAETVQISVSAALEHETGETTVPETVIVDNATPTPIYHESMKWFLNEEIASFDYVEMYISASAKRTDPKYEQLRDPEIRLIRLIGKNGASQINAVIDQAVTEPYSEYISLIQSGLYTSDNLFVCQSYMTVYDPVALIDISFFTYSGTVATGGRLGEHIIFYYDYANDKVLSVYDVLHIAGISEETFLDVFNAYAIEINRRSGYTLEDIQWLLPVQTGIAVSVYWEEYSDYPMDFTIPYHAFV